MKVCSHCGWENRDYAAYCHKCGMALPIQQQIDAAENQSPSVRVSTKIVFGAILPLLAFLVCLGSLLQFENAMGPDYGIVAGTKVLLVGVPGVPLILIINLLLMIPEWKNLKVVCFVGCALPAILLLIECCFLIF